MHTGITERAVPANLTARTCLCRPQLWRCQAHLRKIYFFLKRQVLRNTSREFLQLLNQVAHFRPEDGQEGACHPDTWRSGRPVEARLLERPLRYRTRCCETPAEGQTSISPGNGDILSHKMGHLIEERIGDLGITTSCLPPWFRCARMLLRRNIQSAISLPPRHILRLLM